MTSSDPLKVHHRDLPPVNPVGVDRRTDNVAFLAPNTIAWLQIPLTPARAAALAVVVARTEIPAQKLVLDLLDDVIFSREVA